MAFAARVTLAESLWPHLRVRQAVTSIWKSRMIKLQCCIKRQTRQSEQDNVSCSLEHLDQAD